MGTVSEVFLTRYQHRLWLLDFVEGKSVSTAGKKVGVYRRQRGDLPGHWGQRWRGMRDLAHAQVSV